MPPGPFIVETTVFRSGNSDAIRIPKRFGLAGKRVVLRRAGDALLVEPKRKRRWAPGFLDSFGNVTSDFAPPPRPRASPEAERRAARLFDDDA